MSELPNPPHGPAIHALYQNIAPQYDQIMHDMGWPAHNMLREAVAPVDRALDLGAGTGLSAEALVAAGVKQVVAVDASSAMLDRLQDRFGHDNTSVKPVNMTAEQFLDQATRQFDVVSAIALMHYVSSYRRVVTGVSRLLRRGGIFVFTYDPLINNHPQNGPVPPNEPLYRIPFEDMLAVLQREGFTELYDRRFTPKPLKDNGYVCRFVIARKGREPIGRRQTYQTLRQSRF